MPIRPELRKRFYGRTWRKVTRPRILKRAGGEFSAKGKYLGGARCEQCGVPDRAVGYRDITGRFIELGKKSGASAKLLGYKVIRIVLSVCHKNHQPGADTELNLLALCQRDHLRMDRGQHRRSREARKDRARPLLAEAAS